MTYDDVVVQLAIDAGLRKERCSAIKRFMNNVCFGYDDALAGLRDLALEEAKIDDDDESPESAAKSRRIAQICDEALRKVQALDDV